MKTIFVYSVVLVFLSLGSCKNSKKKKQQLSYTTVTCAPAPLTSDANWYQTNKKAPLFNNLGNYSFQISTQNELVQKYFDQGLILAYGFNHAEAARSFYYATKLDSTCAMAYWGYAYVLGPNYNAGMESDNYSRAYNAIQKAINLSEDVSQKEKELIWAMSKRYSKEVPKDRTGLDQDYSDAMKKLYDEYPKDPDIGTLYAESLMNLHPWDLYEHDGTAKPWTAEIEHTLENIMEISPQHPGVHHFYIHAVEASSSPERGLKSAKLYDEGLVPGAGHLVHMPSHIYIRTGHYHKGTMANINAVEADSLYVTKCHAQGVYPIAYYPHNYHFLAATATLEGNSYWGILAAEKVSKQVSIQLMKEPGWGTLQHYYTIPYYVYVKFGKWDKILNMPDEVPELVYPSAVRAYSRGMAFIGKAELENAKKELIKLEEYSQDESLKELTIWEINSTYDLVQIAKKVLKAEILASEKKYSEAIDNLKRAIAEEDNLNYNEPPDWFFSVRHNLGAVQIEAQKFKEAIKTYQEDLVNYPRNGWALHGMKLAYNNIGNDNKVDEINDQLEEIWSTADTNIKSSRIK